MSKKTICIVDGYSTGAQLVHYFSKLAIRCVHVQSTDVIPNIYDASHVPDFYHHCFLGTTNRATLLDALQAYGVTSVIAGAESGIELADALASGLHLPGNMPTTSALRRDKFTMGEAVRSAGLLAVRQTKAASVDQARKIALEWCQWPIVVKPLNSAGSDSVSFCSDIDALLNAVSGILDNINKLGLSNQAVLLQEALCGQQYIVNAVSYQGKHAISEIWRDDRQHVAGVGLIYDRELLLPFDGIAQDELKKYALAVLDALGIAYGPSHMEIMYTPSGPCLIEVGARMQGGIDCAAVEHATGTNPIALAARQHVYDFDAEVTPPSGYKIRKNLMSVALISRASGHVMANRFDQLLPSLPSFYSFPKRPRMGDPISFTIDLFSSPGTIYLSHLSLVQLENDYQKIRNWELNGELMDVY